jgi:hypothetical protein
MDAGEILKHIIEMKTDISAMKTDLHNHMERTELNEKAIEMLKKYLYMAHGALGLAFFYIGHFFK